MIKGTGMQMFLKIQAEINLEIDFLIEVMIGTMMIEIDIGDHQNLMEEVVDHLAITIIIIHHAIIILIGRLTKQLD